ncbi:MAG: cupin domain-containing protein [bacterium]
MRTLMMIATLAVACPAGALATESAATYFPSRDVTQAFRVGRPLVEVDDYKIHASRRTEAGMGEVHTLDTDIIYVLDGTATFVTGGVLVGARQTAPNEIRGASIDGGETRTLAKGDIVTVPRGVPHWFKSVDAPFLYYVVKVSGGEGGAM